MVRSAWDGHMAVRHEGNQWAPGQDDHTSLGGNLRDPVSIQDFSCIDTQRHIREQKTRVSIQDFSCIDTEGFNLPVDFVT